MRKTDITKEKLVNDNEKKSVRKARKRKLREADDE